MLSLPALRSRNYRLFFAGQLISLIGTWMQQIAMTWLAYRLTDSSAMLGLVAFANQAPILLFSALAGVWNDRLDRRRVLLTTQALSMCQALLLFALTLTHLVTPAVLVLLALLLGCINAIDLPARQAFVAQLVTDKADLPSAIGLNSFLMNASRFVGPALAGLFVAAAGEAACFFLNALSYLAVLIALAAIRVAPRPSRPQPAWTALRAGLTYAFSHPQIRLLLFMVACFSLFVTPYAVMMPVFARGIFHAGAQTYGFLIASAGFGSLSAALFLALRGGRQSVAGLDHLVGRATLAGGVLLAAFSLAPSPTVAYPLLLALGCSVILAVAGSNTLIQIVVEEEYRGRVMAIFSTAFLGIAPLGGLTVGALAEVLGVRPVLFCCGTLAFALGVVFRQQLKKTGAPAGAPSSCP